MLVPSVPVRSRDAEMARFSDGTPEGVFPAALLARLPAREIERRRQAIVVSIPDRDTPAPLAAE
jgi:hypothetical protein